MRSFLRKVRGAIGVSLTWGAAWAAILAAVGLVIGVVDPDSIDPGEGPVRIATIGAMFGFISGAAFSMLLMVAEGRTGLRNLSIGRAALWGALATAVFPLISPADNSMILIFSPVGGALAAGLVAVAKRAELRAAGEQRALEGEGP